MTYYHGDLLTFEEAKAREVDHKQIRASNFLYFFKWDGCQMAIDGTAEPEDGVVRYGRLINHKHTADGPNAITVLRAVIGTPYIVFLAREPIKKGEEILYDYRDDSWKSWCNFTWLAPSEKRAEIERSIDLGEILISQDESQPL